MELKKHSGETLRFKFEDTTFLVKPEATEGDRLELITAGRREGSEIVFSRAEYCRTCIRQMVTGWENVKRDGADVPYSFTELLNFPHTPGKNVLLELGDFVIKNTDLCAPKDEELKKD